MIWERACLSRYYLLKFPILHCFGDSDLSKEPVLVQVTFLPHVQVQGVHQVRLRQLTEKEPHVAVSSSGGALGTKHKGSFEVYGVFHLLPLCTGSKSPHATNLMIAFTHQVVFSQWWKVECFWIFKKLENFNVWSTLRNYIDEETEVQRGWTAS